MLGIPIASTLFTIISLHVSKSNTEGRKYIETISIPASNECLKRNKKPYPNTATLPFFSRCCCFGMRGKPMPYNQNKINFLIKLKLSAHVLPLLTIYSITCHNNPHISFPLLPNHPSAKLRGLESDAARQQQQGHEW